MVRTRRVVLRQTDKADFNMHSSRAAPSPKQDWGVRLEDIQMNRKNGKGVCALAFACALLLSAPALAGPQLKRGERDRQSQKIKVDRRLPSKVNVSQQPQTNNGFRSRRSIVRTPDFVQRSHSNLLKRGDVQTPRFQRPQTPVRLINPRPRFETRSQEIRPQQPTQTVTRPPRRDQPQRTPILQRPTRPPINQPRVVQSRDRRLERDFTRTIQGRRYDNGVWLRRGRRNRNSWDHRFFPLGYYHFPFYRHNYIRTVTYVSLYGYYYGVCAPYIYSSTCRQYPPSVTFVNIPVYSGSRFQGFEDWGDHNLFDDPNLADQEPGLMNALDEITEAFREGNIDALVPLVDPNTMIAVYERGQYKYSISANDYLDLTRDALNSIDTVNFTLDYLHKDAPGVYSASGRQEYRDNNGQLQTMNVSFVLESVSGEWTLTQVGVAPGVYRDIAR